MAGIYKVGFEDGTPVAKAKERALAEVRKTDEDEVTFGPDVVQGDAQQQAGTFLVRVVTGHEQDPAAVAAAKRARVAHVPPADAVIGRLAALPPDKLAALAALIDKMEAR